MMKVGVRSLSGGLFRGFPVKCRGVHPRNTRLAKGYRWFLFCGVQSFDSVIELSKTEIRLAPDVAKGCRWVFGCTAKGVMS